MSIEALSKQEQDEPVAWESVLGAVARGWCYEENANKTMDSELAVAIAKEVHALYTTPQPKQEQGEPVAWGFQNTAITGSNRWMMLREEVPADDQYGGALWTPLYTTPQQRTWVGLIPEEIDEIIENSIDKVDALIQTMDKLKEKNS